MFTCSLWGNPTSVGEHCPHGFLQFSKPLSHEEHGQIQQCMVQRRRLFQLGNIIKSDNHEPLKEKGIATICLGMVFVFGVTAFHSKPWRYAVEEVLLWRPPRVWWKVEVPMDLEVDDFDPYVPWSIHCHTESIRIYIYILWIYTPIGFSLWSLRDCWPWAL